MKIDIDIEEHAKKIFEDFKDKFSDKLEEDWELHKDTIFKYSKRIAKLQFAAAFKSGESREFALNCSKLAVLSLTARLLFSYEKALKAAVIKAAYQVLDVAFSAIRAQIGLPTLKQ